MGTEVNRREKFLEGNMIMKLIAENLDWCLYESGFLCEGTFPFHLALFRDSNRFQNGLSDFHRKQAFQYK